LYLCNNDPYDYGSSYLYDYGNGNDGLKNNLSAKHFLSKGLLKQVKKDPNLHNDVEEYVYNHCNFFDCKYCKNCIADAESKAELRKFLKDNEDIDFFVFKDIKAEECTEEFGEEPSLKELFGIQE
jgi:hypothetical protein